jgi:hypothetical protein
MNNEAQQYHREMANTILTQLGGMMALKLIGGRPASGESNGNKDSVVPVGNAGDTVVDVKFEGEAKEIDGVRPNVVRIIYCLSSDTYRFILFRATGNMARVLFDLSDVYCDMLQDMFEEKTGLFLYFRNKDKVNFS